MLHAFPFLRIIAKEVLRTKEKAGGFTTGSRD
jgi:hypothetical protein